ncbi:CAH14 anhydrase, partial [Formicarius rufipectus]|nr:CAH14 anhydrase [Formicarius rufipectus]
GCPPGPHGQQHWPEGHPECGGRAQSPIDIATAEARPEPALPPLQPQGYERPETPRFTLANNGHTGEPRGVGAPGVPGGPAPLSPRRPAAVLALPPSLRLRGLPGVFAAAQLHFHWGRPGHGPGAEHLLDGHRAPAEVPPGTGGSGGEGTERGMAREMGLGTLTDPPAPLPQVGTDPHPAYDNILRHLGSIRYAGQSTSIPSFSVRDLLPPSLDRYYRYNGSLTTPPCFQSVLWTLFPQPVRVSRGQLEQLQGSLYSTEEAEEEPQLLVDNFRAPQELNQRPVLSGGLPSEPPPWCHTGQVIAIVFGAVAGCVGLFLAAHFGAKWMR